MKRPFHFAALVIALSAAVGAAEPVAAPQPQTVSLGDAHVQSHLPVALVLDSEIRQRLGGTLGAMAGGTSSASASQPVTGVSLEVVWRPGAQGESVLSLDGGAVLLPITPHQAETYTYFVRVRDERGRFEARFPAAPAVYRIEAAAASGPSVIDGTGDGTAEQGEMIPIHVRLALPAQVKDVVLFHRSAPGSSWTSAPMEVKARTDQDGTWSGSVQRPLGGKPELEYYVQASGVDGRVTHYGVPDRPHRLKLVAPVVPAESDE